MIGERISFADIVQMYQQPLYWHIRRVVIIHEDAEDLLQETFMKAYKHIWQLRSPDALKPWLFRIATNEIGRYFKNHRPCSSVEEVPEQSLVRLSDAPGSPSPIAISSIVSAAILQMSPLQRQVFCLRYYEDMDYDQISAITRTSKNTLMVSYHEARKKIEKQIENV